jgi:hypothetical protein
MFMHETDIPGNKYRQNTAMLFVTATNKIVYSCFIHQITAFRFITELRDI